MGPLQRSSWGFCHLLDAALGLRYSQVFLVYSFNFNRSAHSHTWYKSFLNLLFGGVAKILYFTGIVRLRE